MSTQSSPSTSPLKNQNTFAHVLVYIVFGDDAVYYDGVKISILSFFHHIPKTARPLVVVLAEHPNIYHDFVKHSQDPHVDFITLPLTQELKKNWVQDGYGYRIKTLGLAHIIDHLSKDGKINNQSKLLFFDTDTYFTHSPLPLYDLIGENQVVMYKKEPKIYWRKKYRNYVDGLSDKTISYGSGKQYSLQRGANMYSSLIMGVMPAMLEWLYETAELMYPVRELTDARTAEQFCFAEIFKQHVNLVEGKRFVHHYSRKRQKLWVRQQIDAFWKQTAEADFEQKVAEVVNIAFKRPWHYRLKQNLNRHQSK